MGRRRLHHFALLPAGSLQTLSSNDNLGDANLRPLVTATDACADGTLVGAVQALGATSAALDVVVPSVPKLVSGGPPIFARHPTCSRVSALTPRPGRRERSDNKAPFSARAPNSQRWQAPDPAPTSESAVSKALLELFEAYDVDCDGFVDFEEFTEAQNAISAALEHIPDKKATVELFFEARRMFEQHSGPSSGLSFHEFADWQAGLWMDSGKTSEAIVSACQWGAEILWRSREESTRSGGTDVAPVAFMPRAVASAAGRAAAAVRQQRLAKQGVRGGGHSSLKEGFMENTQAMAVDMEEFDRCMEARDSSEDEADRPPDQSQVDSQIVALARERRMIRRKCHTESSAAGEEACQGHVLKLNDQLQKLWCQKRQHSQGKLHLFGTVWSEATRIKQACVELSLLGGKSRLLGVAKSNRRGFFQHRVASSLGRSLTLTVRKDGFAPSCRPITGDSLQQARIELLPFGASGKLQVVPGKRGTVRFEEPVSRASFVVPLSGLLKGDQLFEGEAEFAAAVVDVTSQEGISAMPPLNGRTAGGAIVQIQSLGAVCVVLRDAADLQELALAPETRIAVRLPSCAVLTHKPPSVWQWREARGEWEQTSTPLEVNGHELPPIDVEAEIQVARKDVRLSESLNLLIEIESAAEALDANRQAFKQQFDEEERNNMAVKKMCVCGARGKQAIMAKVSKFPGLEMADPPKRIFAEATSDGFGGLALCFPYTDAATIDQSAARIRTHREVVLSHHLAATQELLQPTGSTSGSSPWPGGHKKWRQAANKSLAHLRYIADWLLEGARVVQAENGDAVDDIDPVIVHVVILARLVDLWAAPRVTNSPGSSTSELRAALRFRGLDITAAFVDVGHAQALRDDVALVRHILRQREPLATAIFADIKKTLEACNGEIEASVESLLKDPLVNLEVDKIRVRKQLYEKNPMAHPRSREVAQAIAEVDKHPKQAATLSAVKHDEAHRKKQQAKSAVEEQEQARLKLHEATIGGPMAERIQAKIALSEKEKMVNVAETVVKAAEDEAARSAAKVEDTSRYEYKLDAAANCLLEKYPLSLDNTTVYRTWKEIMQATGNEHQFSFEVESTGWINIHAPENLTFPRAVPPPKVKDFVEEFYPAPDLPVCPVRTSSIIVGTCDNANASVVAAHGVHLCSMDYAGEVQPDGTFSVVSPALGAFELKTSKWDGSRSHNFGPFITAGADKISHLGVLTSSPDASEEHATAGTEVEVVLPRLDIPPRVLRKDGFATGWNETCTCELEQDEAERQP